MCRKGRKNRLKSTKNWISSLSFHIFPFDTQLQLEKNSMQEAHQHHPCKHQAEVTKSSFPDLPPTAVTLQKQCPWPFSAIQHSPLFSETSGSPQSSWTDAWTLACLHAQGYFAAGCCRAELSSLEKVSGCVQCGRTQFSLGCWDLPHCWSKALQDRQGSQL